MSKPGFELSATQLIATALAAITATVAASYLGVSGTVIGAALASVVSAVFSALYAHSLRSTHARVREVVPMRRTPAPPIGEPPVDELPVLPSPAPRRPAGRPSPLRRAAIGAIAAFTFVLSVITGIEIIAGRPISDLVRGDAGSGTSFFGGESNAGAAVVVPTVTRTVIPSVVVTTPTVTQTAPAVTKTATPTITGSPSDSGSADPSAPATIAPSESGAATSSAAP